MTLNTCSIRGTLSVAETGNARILLYNTYTPVSHLRPVRQSQQLLVDGCIALRGDMKKCTKCEKIKLLSEFSKQRNRRDGVGSLCVKCMNEKCRIYHASHKEQRNAYNKQYQAAHLEQARARVRKYREAHPEDARAAVRKYRRSNPERVQERERAGRAYRVLKTGKKGTITAAEWRWLKEYYNFTCLRCGKKEPEIKLTLDHVMPLVLGGKHLIENAQCLCRSCNSTKGAKHIDYRKSPV